MNQAQRKYHYLRMFNTIIGIGLLVGLILVVGTIVIMGWSVEGPRRFFKYLTNHVHRP